MKKIVSLKLSLAIIFNILFIPALYCAKQRGYRGNNFNQYVTRKNYNNKITQSAQKFTYNPKTQKVWAPKPMTKSDFIKLKGYMDAVIGNLTSNPYDPNRLEYIKYMGLWTLWKSKKIPLTSKIFVTSFVLSPVIIGAKNAYNIVIARKNAITKGLKKTKGFDAEALYKKMKEQKPTKQSKELKELFTFSNKYANNTTNNIPQQSFGNIINPKDNYVPNNNLPDISNRTTEFIETKNFNSTNIGALRSSQVRKNPKINNYKKPKIMYETGSGLSKSPSDIDKSKEPAKNTKPLRLVMEAPLTHHYKADIIYENNQKVTIKLYKNKRKIYPEYAFSYKLEDHKWSQEVDQEISFTLKVPFLDKNNTNLLRWLEKKPNCHYDQQKKDFVCDFNNAQDINHEELQEQIKKIAHKEIFFIKHELKEKYQQPEFSFYLPESKKYYKYKNINTILLEDYFATCEVLKVWHCPVLILKTSQNSDCGRSLWADSVMYIPAGKKCINEEGPISFTYGHEITHAALNPKDYDQSDLRFNNEIASDLGGGIMSYLTTKNTNKMRLMAANWLLRLEGHSKVHPYNEQRAASLFELATKIDAALGQLNIK